MATISKEEIKRIAHMSRIAVDEQEFDALAKQLQEVLSYAARVAEVAQSVPLELAGNVNVFRDDKVIATNPEPILARAPQEQEHYFVVPAVLDNE